MANPADILATQGFTQIGMLQDGLNLSVWWNRNDKIEVLLLKLPGGRFLLKGTKAYHLLSISEEGETWARDIPVLHDYLEGHFREMHLSFSFIRDVPAFMAERKARECRRSNTRASPGESPTALRNRLMELQCAINGTEQLRSLNGQGDSELLDGYLGARIMANRKELEHVGHRLTQVRQLADDDLHLQQQYRHKGSAASLIFSIASNLQVATSDDELRDALKAAVKELRDADRFQVKQTLTGGRLRIQVAEADQPVAAWIEQWFGGLLNPSQLERLRSEAPQVVELLTNRVVITPDEDITDLNGTLADHRKLLAPRITHSLVSRLDNAGDEFESALGSSAPARLLRVGRDADGADHEAVDLPLDSLGHTYISGKTGGGKSVALRVLAEEIAGHKNVSILIIDPRNQFFGIRLPQDRPEMLARYPAFDLDEPQGFPFTYHAPSIAAATPLPSDLGVLAGMRSVLSLKKMDDVDRCRLFHQVLDAAFERCAQEEVPAARLVIAIEEAHLFTRRLVVEEAREEAQRCEQALDRVLREGRKYGICVLLSSQSIKDFARELASIRQNTTTRIFFNNSDREIEYAKGHLEDAADLIKLRPGTAFVCNPGLGVLKVAFRPCLSKVWDLPEAQILSLLSQVDRTKMNWPLSAQAGHLLETIQSLKSCGVDAPNLTQVAGAAGITSKRLLSRLICELLNAGHIQLRRAAGRGRPKLIKINQHTKDVGKCQVEH